jgi:hypothetical protein
LLESSSRVSAEDSLCHSGLPNRFVDISDYDQN